jgi:hypothetical protein
VLAVAVEHVDIVKTVFNVHLGKHQMHLAERNGQLPRTDPGAGRALLSERAIRNDTTDTAEVSDSVTNSGGGSTAGSLSSKHGKLLC